MVTATDAKILEWPQIVQMTNIIYAEALEQLQILKMTNKIFAETKE